MKLLSTLLVFAGYTLVYAAVANHGKYAQIPWLGVFRDAYGVDAAKHGAAPGGSGAAPGSNNPATNTNPNKPRYASGPPVNSRPRTPGVKTA